MGDSQEQKSIPIEFELRQKEFELQKNIELNYGPEGWLGHL